MLRSIGDFFPDGAQMAYPAALYLDPTSIIGITVHYDPPRLVLSMPAELIDVRFRDTVLGGKTDPGEIARAIVTATNEDTLGEVAAMREHCAQLAERAPSGLPAAAMIRAEPRDPEKHLVVCDCGPTDKCPQGRTDIELKCQIWKR